MKPKPLSAALLLAAALAGPMVSAARSETTSGQVSGETLSGLHLTANGAGPTLLALRLQNPTPSDIAACLPAGATFAGPDGSRIVTLRSLDTTIPAGKTADAEIPAASLTSSAGGIKTDPYALQPGSADPRLKPLLNYLATAPDVPRATSQLLVLALLENIDFQRWEAFGAPAGAPDSKKRTEPVFQSIDALGILKEIAPEQTFALAADPELKLRALRTPACRGKAMQIYGISVETDGDAGGVPAQIGQLLHTKPGDNCPICKMRQQMEGGANKDL